VTPRSRAIWLIPWHVDTAVSDATRAVHHALRARTWIPGQQQRLRKLAPGTWQQALASVLAVTPGRPDDQPGHAAVEIAIYPDVVWLAARALRVSSGEPGYHCCANGSCSPPDGRQESSALSDGHRRMQQMGAAGASSG
jgi:hypothetical protein